MNVKRFAELRGPRLQTTPTTLNLTRVKVLQDSVKTEGTGPQTGSIKAVSVGGVKEEAGLGLHCRHGLVLEGDEGHAQRFGVDLLLLLPVLLLQLGLPFGVEADGLLLVGGEKK